MDQPTFADLEFQGKKRKTRRELFLERMGGLIPWQRLEERIRPFYYPKAGKGRRPYPLPVMLRIHCVQLFYNLSAPGMEDLLYEAASVRRFVGLRRSEAMPDETTILNFRYSSLCFSARPAIAAVPNGVFLHNLHSVFGLGWPVSCSLCRARVPWPDAVFPGAFLLLRRRVPLPLLLERISQLSFRISRGRFRDGFRLFGLRLGLLWQGAGGVFPWRLP